MMTPTSQRSTHNKKLHQLAVEEEEEEGGAVKAEITLLPSGRPHSSPARSRNMNRARP